MSTSQQRSIARSVGWTTGACLLIAACGGSSEGASGSASGFSVVDALGQLPASSADGTDPLDIAAADLSAASEAAGVDRPADGADPDAVIDWIGPLVGLLDPSASGAIFVPLASLFRDNVPETVAFEEELGFDLTGVTSYVEALQVPGRFTVVELDDDAARAATERLGTTDGDVVSVGDGDDFEVLPDTRTAARPLGRPLRLATRENSVAIGLSTPVVEDWVADDGDTLADDAGLADIATTLDESDVVSVFLERGDFSADSALGAGATPEARAEFSAQLAGIAPFTAIGIGWRADPDDGDGEEDDDGDAVVVYSFADDAGAEASEDSIESAYEGTSASGRPMSDFLEVVAIEVDGATVTADVRFAADVSPEVLLGMLFRREVIFVHP